MQSLRLPPDCKRLRGQGVADAVADALPHEELEEEARVAEAPVHVGAVLALQTADEDGDAVTVGEPLDVVVHRVRHQAALSVSVAMAPALSSHHTCSNKDKTR